MKKHQTILATLALASCGGRRAWQAVEVGGRMRCDSLHSAGTDGSPLQCRPWMEGDTLTVHISSLDFGWEAITLKIHGGRFSAQLGGVPFHTVKTPSFETVSQRLRLAKDIHGKGDTLCARFDLRFRVSFPGTDGLAEWTFRGTVCEVIRVKDFDPFAVENVMTFDLPTALHKMGEPLDRRVFGVADTTEFSVELPDDFPRSADIVCEEVTWDASPMREVSDEERERLTVWYIERDGRLMSWSAGSGMMGCSFEDERSCSFQRITYLCSELFNMRYTAKR